ncbi:MAG: hypothetical protein NDJ75_02830 [Thermoanaerobaculia bacterium]|nr:hypothetical protein [Thermoanaerobaculia bacterium]
MGPLVLLAIVPLAAATMIALRWRALRRPLDGAAAVDAPLAPGELQRLRRWHRRVQRALLLVAVAYLGLVAASLVDGEPPAWRAGLALGLLGAACLLATAIQFSERCPRCGYNLGFQSRLALPASCERCRGALS